MTIFLERIPLRLNEINDLQYPDTLHLVHSSLKGFQKLYKLFGNFSINENCIGINTDGRIKTWINSDFNQITTNID